MILVACFIGFGAYGLAFRTEPLGVIALATALLILAGNTVFARFGLRQSPGRRFFWGWTWYQEAIHPRRPMAPADAEAAWEELGLPTAHFVGALHCGDHCDARLFVGEVNGKRYYVGMGAESDGPFPIWSAGWMFVRARDLPFAAIPLRDAGSATTTDEG